MMKNSDSKLSVLHISTAKGWRGGERQIANLIKGLISGYPAINVKVFCRKNEPFHQFCIKNRLNHITFDKSDGLLGAAKKLKSICEKEVIDLIHTHDSHGHTMAIIAADLYRNKPKVVVHRRVAFKNSGILSKYKYNHRKIAAYIPISKTIEKVLRETVKKSNEYKISLIYSSIDISAIENVTKANIREELSLDDNTILIGNISALADKKGYKTFLEAAKLLVESNSNIHFIIVGDGSLKEELINYTSSLGIESYVHFLGFKENAIAYLKCFDILMMPSEAEGLGTSVLEAFACRIPVVSTAAGGLKEIVRHQETGLVAPVGDALTFAGNCKILLSDPSLKLHITDNSHKMVIEKFTIDKMVQKTVELYKSIT